MKKTKFFKSYVTITVLILMMVLVAISYLYADSLFAELAIARNNKSSSVAFALAEAGVQEAIYQVKYKLSVRTAFVAGTTCCDTFTYDPALIDNGSFEETINVTGRGLATITAIGRYKTGLRTAVRRVKTSIAQSVDNPAYNGDSGIFISDTGQGPPSPLTLNQTTIKVYGGGILSGGGLDFNQSQIDAEKTIEYKNSLRINKSSLKCNCMIDTPDPEGLIPMCSDAPACTPTVVDEVGSIPTIDIITDYPDSYKSRSKISPNHYFLNQSNFLSDMAIHGNIISGIVYVEVGSNGTLDIGKNNFTINGVLATSNSISVPNGGTLNINKLADQPAGIIVPNTFEVKNNGVFSCTGLIYGGNKVELNLPTSPTINVYGGIFSRYVYINQGDLVIRFDKDIINAALPMNPLDTPVIQRTFWEEEY